MIKLFNSMDEEVGTLLYDKHVPNQGDYIISNDTVYRVLQVVYDDDDNEILLRVEKGIPAYGIPKYSAELTFSDPFKEVRRLALIGEKLRAVKLYKELTGKGLKECKDYVDSLG